MADRIDVEEARRRVSRGGALLVCAYADESRCERIRLEGSISLAQLEGLVETLPRNREIVFYCA